MTAVAEEDVLVQWDDTYDGAWDTAPGPALERDVAFEAPGRYTVKARAVATDGRIGYATLTLDIEGVPVAPPDPEPPEPPAVEPDPSPEPTPVGEPRVVEEAAPSSDDGGCQSSPRRPAPTGWTLWAAMFMLVVWRRS